jgi:hypothetical protein
VVHSQLALDQNWPDLLAGHCVEQAELVKPLSNELTIGLGSYEVALVAQMPKGSCFVLVVVGGFEKGTSVLAIEGHQHFGPFPIAVVDVVSRGFCDVENPIEVLNQEIARIHVDAPVLEKEGQPDEIRKGLLVHQMRAIFVYLCYLANQFPIEVLVKVVSRNFMEGEP